MRIGIIGAPSTGKTTLAKMFDNHIVDVERDAINEFGGDVKNITDIVGFQKSIANRQMIEEMKKQDFVTDNPLHTSLAYCKMTENKKLIEWIENHIKIYGQYDFLFITPIEFDLVNDGVRHTDPVFQHIIQDMLYDILNGLGTDYTELRGTVEERYAKIIETIDLQK